jgi:surface polysaccharide O-acyltransferase-like enzyme
VWILEAISYVPCCASGCLFMLALFVRFGNRHVRALDVLAGKAYGMYLVHYLFSIWLQFLLLGVAAIALIKAAVVFSGTVALSFGTVAAIQRAFLIARVERRRNPGAALPS